MLLMLDNEYLWSVSKTQPILACTRAKKSRNATELIGSLGRPDWSSRKLNGQSNWTCLVFISDEEHKRTLVYMAAAEKNRCFQWEFFCNFNKLVNTMSHTQWAFWQTQASNKWGKRWRKSKRTGNVFRLTTKEQSAEDWKSLQAQNEIKKAAKS